MAQPQLLQIKLSRFDAQPWGFRLQGGTDFAQPLLVQKVNAGSLSEQAGLQPGDAVVKINDVDVFNLRHKDAQDIVVRSGNNFVITVQRGGSTWRPHVTPTGNVPQPNSPYLQTVTKTSLAHKQQDSQHIGCGYNNAARPFSNGGDGGVKSIVNKQYNTPVGIYSDESIAETLSAQAEVLAGGVLGVNFKKNEKEYQGDRSEVLKFLREEETGQSTPEPHSPANFYWTQSHAIGGNERRTPLHHQHQQPQQDERIGVPLQSNTLAPEATHRPSLPVAPKDNEEQARQDQQEQPDPRIIVLPICPGLQGPEYKAEMEAAAAALATDQDGRPRPLAASGHPACQLCGVGIVGVFVRIKDKNLHVECFKCATCGTSLKNQGYYNFNNKLYCDIHAKQAAINNPPTGTEGYVPVPIKPNTKLSASTISSALNSHGYGGHSNGYSNGNSTPAPAPVNQGYARPFGAAAPKSPVSYPPQQQQQSPRPAPGGQNPYATLPRSNVGQQGRNVRYQQQQQQQQQYNNQQKQQYRNSYPMGSNYSTPSQSPYITSNTNNYSSSNSYNNNNYSNYNNNNVYRDELVRPDQALTPTRPYTPSLTNKPAPIVPFYQTEEKLVFEECSATHARNYNELNASPFPDRTRSPAPGPPPNPLNAIRAPRMKEPETKSNILSVSGGPRLQTGSITTGQSYQGQLLAHSEQSSQSASQSYNQQPERITEQRVGNLNIQQREQSSQLQQQAQSQTQSQTRSQVGNTQIERRRKVTEEFERTQSAKTIEIRTGSQSVSQSKAQSQSISQAQTQAQSQSQNQSDTERRSSYGKTGFVASQAKRLSCMEEEISSLTSQSQAISARASALGEGCFPNLRSPTFDSKFPLKPAPAESIVPGYATVPAATKMLTAPPPGFLQQQQQQQQRSAFSGYQATTSSVQQSSFASSSKATTSSLSSSSASASASASVARSSQSLTQASAITTTTNNQATTAYRSSNGSITKPNLASRPSIASITAPGSASAPAPVPSAAPTKATAPFKAPIVPKSVIANAVNAAAPPAPAVFPPDLSDLNLNSNVDNSPGAGGKSAGAFGATSAPKRGRGILNKAAGPGVRIPLCNSCNVQIRGPFITALGRIWCPDHFICVNGNCRRPLQDIGFVEEKGDLYCEYCFEKYLAPTCSKCAGKIKGDCLNAIGKHFHPECFTCGQCGKIFGNRPFFLEDGNAYCEADWNELFTTKCFACGFPVEAGDRWVEALNHNYHSQCFNCTFCKQNLEGQSFYNKGGRPFCKNHAR
uniref:Z band alternatively spliced PDZ-motif protein 52, isoform N n=1 Tax=Drosophila melanogaster TaxID=7227 RepID=A0A0B4KER6_DROME|nr:Z band alternatively spliced PDZ-motif protein 52, isoform N [Drosophila melanogaster]AGB93539.1 Z band alternatively spliced PDZ-motif protein 52, isoform N [Drosophila melanogaster]|eukprot:NP_001261007.1 Z band alternatively spliced PDZ-motif protein 52, isoform N [Drosophila melanogaster]